MEVDALYSETMQGVVALEAAAGSGGSSSSPTKGMEVDALYSETMQDVVALEAAAGSGGSSSSPTKGMEVDALYSEAMRDVVVALEADDGDSSEESSPRWVSAVAVMQIDNNWIRCSVCSQNLLYLKCPVFQCNNGHLACQICRAQSCEKCKDGGARFDARNTVAEHIILDSRFKCPHRGCHGFFSYHEVTAHNDVCPQAPCTCAEPGCGFASPPHPLLRHLVSEHSWPAHAIQYGKPFCLRVPTSGPCRRRLLLALDDARVFALVVGAVHTDTAVSLVCVRGGASPQPSYKARLCAVVVGRTSMVDMKMVTSSSRPGEVVLDNLPCILTVPRTYLITEDEASKEVSLKISVEISCSD